MTWIDIALPAYLLSILVAMGVIMGFSFASEDRGSVYLLWLAPIWPVALIVAIPGLFVYRMFKRA